MAQGLVFGEQGLEPLLKFALKDLWNVFEQGVQAGDFGKGRLQLPFHGPEFAKVWGFWCGFRWSSRWGFSRWVELIFGPNKNRSSRRGPLRFGDWLLLRLHGRTIQIGIGHDKPRSTGSSLKKSVLKQQP